MGSAEIMRFGRRQAYKPVALIRYARPVSETLKQPRSGLYPKMLLANLRHGFQAHQTACRHACHRPAKRSPSRFASSIISTDANRTDQHRMPLFID